MGYQTSAIIGYLMQNHFYIYILDIQYLVWFSMVLGHINYYRLFNAKSSLSIVSTLLDVLIIAIKYLKFYSVLIIYL